MPKGKEKEDLHRVRKDSISSPQPLGSPFDMGRLMSKDADGGYAEANDVGKAI
jgi:hypothetical protein